jgi:hypothetical protein
MAGGIVMLACAALLLFGTVTRSWFVYGEHDFKGGVGLVGGYACSQGHCEGKWFDTETRGLKPDIVGEKYLGFLGGLASVALCVIAGAMALGNKPRKIPLLALYIVVGITGALMLLFIARVFSETHGGGLKLGYSAYTAILGVIGAFIAAAAMLGPVAKRAGAGQPVAMGYPMHMQQPMMMQPPMMMQQPQGCPRCGNQLTFVPQYQRFFCQRCQQYA